jgi:hypothetical protein
MSDQNEPKYATAADLDRILEERERAAQQRPAQAARADFIAQQQARIDGLDGVPAEYLARIGTDPARWTQEAKRARLQWLFDTGKASSSDAMQLGLMDSKPARETPTTSFNLAEHLSSARPGGGGGPNRAA